MYTPVNYLQIHLKLTEHQNCLAEAILMSTHDQVFGTKIMHTPVWCTGVNISRICCCHTSFNLNSLLVTLQMTLFHQGVRMWEKLVPRTHERSELGHTSSTRSLQSTPATMIRASLLNGMKIWSRCWRVKPFWGMGVVHPPAGHHRIKDWRWRRSLVVVAYF